MVPVSRLPKATRPSTASDPWAPMAHLAHLGIHAGALVAAAQRQADDEKLAMSDEPPWLMKGSVMPVSRMSRVTPPTMMNACSTIMEVRPTAVNELTSDFARRCDDAADGEAQVQQQHRPRPEASLSAMAAKMKSLSATGMPPPPRLTAHAAADADCRTSRRRRWSTSSAPAGSPRLGLGEGVLPNGDAGCLHTWPNMP